MNFKKFKADVKQYYLKNNLPINEVDYLFCEVFNIDLSKLVFRENISLKETLQVNKVLSERKKGKPLNKIFNRAYFYGLEFYINNDVLAPRKETELLVENALKLIGKNNKVLDLCTGSGVIAICLSKFTNSKVFASDISTKALKVAKQNAKTFNQNIEFIKSDLFSNINEKFDMIVSNPPYIKSSDITLLDKEVKNYDPIIALDGGNDGLEFYRRIIKDCDKHLNKKGKILFEIGYDEAKQVSDLLKDKKFNVKVIKDYSNNDRIVIGEKI